MGHFVIARASLAPYRGNLFLLGLGGTGTLLGTSELPGILIANGAFSLFLVLVIAAESAVAKPQAPSPDDVVVVFLVNRD